MTQILPLDSNKIIEKKSNVTSVNSVWMDTLTLLYFDNAPG